MRIDKFLANSGIGTRKEVKELLKKKRISVNDEVVTEAKTHIDEDNDFVAFDGKRIEFKEFLYIMLNKPQDVISATDDERHRTVLDLLEEPLTKVGLFPVGRLDKDTEGLLVLTNDGKMAHELLSPKKHVAKTYYARIEGKVTAEDVTAFRKGLDIGEKNLTKPAELVILKSDSESEIEVTITEGKYHQIKRMFEKTGKKVIYLKRLSMGSLKLDETLATGAYRPLTESELQALKEG